MRTCVSILILIAPYVVYAEEPVTSEDMDALPKPAIEAPAKGEVEILGKIPDWIVRWEYAQVLSYLGRHHEAIAEYRVVLREQPDLLKAKEELVKVLFWKGDLSGAEEALRSLPASESSDLQLIKAHLLTRKGHHREATLLLQSLVERSPRDPKLRFFLSQSLLWGKDVPRAITELQLLTREHPQDKQLRRHLARALTIGGRHREAAKELAASLR